MNFLPAYLDDGKLETPLGNIALPDEMVQKIEGHGKNGGDVIAGIRPEDFEDASLVGDKRDHGMVIDAAIDVVESLGSDKFVYFGFEGGKATHNQLEDAATMSKVPR
jgi:multiple sugar transport system ATP-binding protein